jgi:hypothetical protein
MASSLFAPPAIAASPSRDTWRLSSFTSVYLWLGREEAILYHPRLNTTAHRGATIESDNFASMMYSIETVFDLDSKQNTIL